MRPADWMLWRLVRHARPSDTVIVGVNTPLAMAAAMVARELQPSIRVLFGGAVDPEPHDIAQTLADPRTLQGRSAGVLGQTALIDRVQRGDVSLQFVSPAQIDREGRLNTVHVGGRWLAGPLAIPDVAACVGRLIAYRADHSPRTFVARVDHVTGAGPDTTTDRWRSARRTPGAGLAAAVTASAEIAWTDEGRRLTGLRGALTPTEALEPIPFDVEVAIDDAPPPDAFFTALDRIDPGCVRDREVRV